MLRNRRDVLLVSVIALLLLPAQGWEAQGGRASPPPPSGDWTVTDATSISGTTIVLTGNLTIMPGGILTLDRVVLVVACSFGGQFCITVRAGGELHLRQSNLTAQNLSRKFDFSAQSGSVLEMTKSEVHGAGSIWVEPAQTSGIMVRTGSATFTDTVFSQNTVALDIRNCSPTVTNCTFYDNLAAVVAYNSSMQFQNSFVSRAESGGILLYDRTNITLSGCNFTQNFRSAVYANHSSVTLSRNTFYQNYISVHSEDSAGLRIDNSSFTDDKYIAITVYRCPSVSLGDVTVRGAVRMGLRAESCRVSAVNSTFSSGLYDIQLHANSTGDLVNCTFTPHNLNLLDPASRINVSWFVGALVRWWSNGTPVLGADITLTNSTGNLTAKGTTDAQGRFSWGVVLNYTLGTKTLVNFGPYNVTAKKKGLTTTVESAVNRSLDVEILLDDIGPVIRVDFPQNNAFLNLTRVTLKGLAWDNETQVASIECKVDNGSFASASGSSFWEFTTGLLVNGPHTVLVRGRDTSNNTNQLTVAFTLDTFAPTVFVSSPSDGGFTRESNVTVIGTTERNATVTVNGTSVNVSAPAGAFNLTVELQEGDNLIEVVATDRAGNRGVKVVRFRKDTIVTPIDIYPRNGTWTNLTEISLFGQIEENSTILIRTQDAFSNFTTNETRFNVTTGTFSVKVALRNGTNLFRIDILDGYGNNATEYITIIQDRAAPFLNVSSPPVQTYYTRERRLMLEGRTEPGATLYLNGRVKLSEDGNFSWPLTLDIGENVLNITAVDAAGNAVSVVYKAILDRTPPMLLLSSPKLLASGKPLKLDAGTLKVRGTTESEALVYITVNGKPVNNGKPIAVDAFGGFRKDIQLQKGYNTIEVTAIDRAGNPHVEQRVVKYEPPPPLLSNEQLAALIVVIGIVVGLVSVVAWDTKKSTGRWGLKRPAWFRLQLPEYVKDRARAVRAFVPKPEFGREEHEAGIGAVPAEPGKEGKEPQAAGAPAPVAAQWDAAAPPGAAPAEPAVPPVPPIGKEFSVSEKPAGAPATRPIPGASELPVAEPAAGTAPPAGAAPAGPAAPGAPAPGPAPAPAQPPSPPPPAEPPKPKEVDPLAEIMGAPTKKL
jgi:hypothetical protein